MNIQDEFIKEVRAVFKKYNVFLDIYDDYGDCGYLWTTYELKSRNFVNGRLPILIEGEDLNILNDWSKY